MQSPRAFLKSTFTFRVRGVFLIIAGLAVIGVLAIIPPSWEYSNSPEFCGTTCHTMPPEFSTYLESPHASILCVDCHIGRDLILVQFTRKIGHARLIAATVLDDFEYPIRAGELRPANETCEECHTPAKFSDDSLRVVDRAEGNRDNDLYEIYLLMHTGGGTEREGLGRGIHWHIENEVTFIALDDLEQDIPWVRVKYADGSVDEYNALNSPIDTSNLDQYEMHQIECTTCHNRISHLINPPEDAVDSALHDGDISTEIPFIRTRGVELLSAKYQSKQEAFDAIASLDEYYRDYYPDFYAENDTLVAEAIDLLSELYDEGNFPDQLLSWDTHPNNIGHKEWPGCFRCHDGQHFNEQNEAIRLECNLCHAIPEVVHPGDIEPELALTTGLEPETHLDSTWISRHHLALDASCANCHTVTNPGGTDDSSFCSNSACHGAEWEYAGFDAPGLATVLGIYQVNLEPLLEDFEGDPTYQILQPLFAQQCGPCHGAVPTNGLRVTDYESILAGSDNGPVIVPGDLEQSKIAEVLTTGHFAQLTEHQLDLILQWVANGAPET